MFRTKWFSRLTALTCFAYLLVLSCSVVVLRWVGEEHWMTGMAMYLPRILFGLPLLLLTPLLLWQRATRLLWTQLAAALIVVFPLMGLTLPQLPRAAASSAIRVLSYNIARCDGDEELLAQRILEYAPDVVLLQEICPDPDTLRQRLAPSYPEIHVRDQFLLASRYPLRGVRELGHFEFGSRPRSERFMRYELETPLGPVAFYNLHPVSVRWAVYAVRGMRVRTSLRAGTFWRGGAAEEPMNANFELRRLQLAAAAKLAAGEDIPRIIAGDTNVTGLSPVFARYFGDYQDGFRSAGLGFGYTFPSVQPWMRLDRILASQELRFQSFQVGCGTASDHRCVIAEIDRRSAQKSVQP